MTRLLRRFSVRSAITALALSASTGCGGQASGTTSARVSGPPDLERCENLDDETSGRVTVVLENGTRRALYVGPATQPCYASSAPALFAVAATDGSVGGNERRCGALSCGQVAKGDAGLPCTNICIDRAPYTLLPAGEKLTTAWIAEQLVDYELPPKCTHSESTQTSCTRAEPVALGTALSFSAQASTEIDCSTVPGGCNGCPSESAEGCVVQGKTPTGTIIHANSAIVLDERHFASAASAEVVTLRFVE